MAKHYLATTSSAIEILDYSYGSSDWMRVILTISIAANGTVTYTATSTNSTGGWKYGGFWINVNGYALGNNYFNTTSECEAQFGKGSKFPIATGSTYSGSAGTVTGDSVSYEMKLDCGSDGGVHGWTGSASNNYCGVTVSGTVYRNYYGDPGLPTVTVNNTYQNSFTLTATKGSNGTNNAATGVTSIQYSFDNSTWTNYTGAVSITADKTVYARAVTTGRSSNSSAGNTNTNNGQTSVYYYTSPTQASNLTITSSEIKNTPKADYTFSWTNPTPGDHNPLDYVLFRVYKNSTQITTDSEHEYRDGRTSVTLTPQQLGGLAKDDTLSFSVDGLASNAYYDQGPISSEEITIVNSNLLKVGTSNGWKECQVFIMTDSGLKEVSIQPSR